MAVHADGKPVKFTLTADTSVGDVHSYRLQIATRRPGPVGAALKTWTLVIDPAVEGAAELAGSHRGRSHRIPVDVFARANS